MIEPALAYLTKGGSVLRELFTSKQFSWFPGSRRLLFEKAYLHPMISNIVPSGLISF
jgi:hypothetical protein